MGQHAPSLRRFELSMKRSRDRRKPRGCVALTFWVVPRKRVTRVWRRSFARSSGTVIATRRFLFVVGSTIS